MLCCNNENVNLLQPFHEEDHTAEAFSNAQINTGHDLNKVTINSGFTCKKLNLILALLSFSAMAKNSVRL